MVDWAVILDIGQYSSKIGWGGENEPRSTFITVVGTPKYQQMVGGTQNKQVYVGNEIIDALGLYKISYQFFKIPDSHRGQQYYARPQQPARHQPGNRHR